MNRDDLRLKASIAIGSGKLTAKQKRRGRRKLTDAALTRQENYLRQQAEWAYRRKTQKALLAVRGE